jgi:GDP-L-fucose synthase
MAIFDLTGRRMWVAGHRGMVGSALKRQLVAKGHDVVEDGPARIDLRRQSDVENWMFQARPDVVFVAAAKVGGIYANDTRPGEFLYDNLMIEANIAEAARRLGVSKLMMLGSSCIYPKTSPQPIPETALLTGPLEKTNEAYAVAKIAGIELCRAYRKQYGCDFISVMPTNLYGPGDNFDLTQSHVLPSLMRKAHYACHCGEGFIHVWGTGAPRREFMYVDDLAEACIFLMENYSAESHVNVGVGEDLTIRELAELVCEVVGFRGLLQFDPSKPDGVTRKLMDISLLNSLGWRHKTGLREGIEKTYSWFQEH